MRYSQQLVHAVLASEGLMKLKRNIIKTQRVLTCATICALETVVGDYRSDKGRLSAIKTALPILHRLAAIAPNAAGLGGIGGKQYKQELDKLLNKAEEDLEDRYKRRQHVHVCRHPLLESDFLVLRTR